MPRFSACAPLALILAAALVVRAADQNATSAATSSVAPIPAPSGPALTLQDCIAQAMKRNFDLQISGYSSLQSKESLIIAQAGFDPTLTASSTRSVSQAASSTSTLDGTTSQGPRSDNTNTNVGVSERVIQTNGTVSVSANINRAASNSTNSLLNPSFGSGISANISQPLLRTAGGFVARAPIERARIGVDAALLSYKSSVLTVIRSTEGAYYNLVASRETLHIRELSLALAQSLLDENTTRRATGLLTDLDVATAASAFANARLSVIQAQANVRTAEDSLLTLLNAPDYDVRPGPVAFDAETEGPPSFATSYKMARDYYPDTLSTQDTIKQLELDLEVAKKNELPTLNLNATLGYTARATNQGYSDAIGNVPTDHGNNWSLGLNYSAPWGRRADQASYRSTLDSLNSQKTRLDQAEQQLLVNVRTAVRSVETNLASVDIAAQATELSVKQYDLQKARFDAGLSTSRLVQQSQDDLETARLNELNARVSLRTSRAELHRLEGSSIDRFRIQLPQ